jgi:hypothetical protein
MNDKDLLNMLRHAFCMGFNEGMLATRKAARQTSILDSNKCYEEGMENKDECLQEIMDSYHESGFCCYNDDHGSCGEIPEADIYVEAEEPEEIIDYD